jgi:hypothetical protein
VRVSGGGVFMEVDEEGKDGMKKDGGWGMGGGKEEGKEGKARERSSTEYDMIW